MAITCLCGGKLETQADVTVLKRYPTGWQKQDVQLEGRWLYFGNDIDLLEIIFLKDNHRFEDGVQSVDMRGSVNLTNIVILDAEMDPTDFLVDKETKLQRIASAIPEKTRIFSPPEEGEGKYSVRMEEKEKEIITSTEDYRRIWLVVDKRENEDGELENDVIIAWSGGFLEHDHELTDNPPGNVPDKIEYDKIDLDDREYLVRDREFGFVISSKNRRRNDLRSHYTKSGFFRLEPQE